MKVVLWKFTWRLKVYLLLKLKRPPPKKKYYSVKILNFFMSILRFKIVLTVFVLYKSHILFMFISIFFIYFGIYWLHPPTTILKKIFFCVFLNHGHYSPLFVIMEYIFLHKHCVEYSGIQCDAIRWEQLENGRCSIGYIFWTNDHNRILKTPTLP